MRVRTLSIRSDNSSFDRPTTMMSSMYAASPSSPVCIVSMICWKIGGSVLPQTVTVDIGIGRDEYLSSVVLWRLQRPRLVCKPLLGLLWKNRCRHWVWWRYLLKLAVIIDDLSVLHWGKLWNQHTPELSLQFSYLPQWMLLTVSMLLVRWSSFLLGVLVAFPPVVVLCMVPGVWDGTQV